jgi:hypothetical protein
MSDWARLETTYEPTGELSSRENRRNVELFTNKHKIVATFIHVGNNQELLETL